jgi:hypothetical protein
MWRNERAKIAPHLGVVIIIIKINNKIINT